MKNLALCSSIPETSNLCLIEMLPIRTSVTITLAAFLISAAILVEVQGAARGRCEGKYMVVMGASMVDVGENAAAMPGRSASEFPPYGVRRFGKPAARFSDGYLLIDFITQGLGYEILDPFLKLVVPNFAHGVNFASSASTARNTTVKGNGTDSSGLFSLDVQIDQYRSFKANVLTTQSSHNGYLKNIPNALDLSKVVYFIETAHNDYISTFLQSTNFDPPSLVHSVISAIEIGIKDLHTLGAHTIIVMNLIPLGCTPSFLAFSTTIYPNVTLDKDGCEVSLNNIINLHNAQLQELVSKLRTELPLENLVVFDANSIYLDALHQPSKYGVKHPLEACCGAGGNYNVILSIPCGAQGISDGKVLSARSCENPSEYISWDGLHPTEVFARHLAYGVISGKYLRPNISVEEICKA